jgi:hypothetical protein
LQEDATNIEQMQAMAFNWCASGDARFAENDWQCLMPKPSGEPTNIVGRWRSNATTTQLAKAELIHSSSLGRFMN